MAKKGIPQRKRLAAVFASFAILIMGTASLLQSMSLDYYSVLNTLNKIIPAGFVMGILGWVMGTILDQPRKSRRGNYRALIAQELAKYEGRHAQKASADVEPKNVFEP